MAGAIYRGQEFSFNDAWREMSIGNMLQYEQVAWLCEEGAHRYDMGPLTDPLMALTITPIGPAQVWNLPAPQSRDAHDIADCE